MEYCITQIMVYQVTNESTISLVINIKVLHGMFLAKNKGFIWKVSNFNLLMKND